MGLINIARVPERRNNIRDGNGKLLELSAWKNFLMKAGREL